MDQYRAPRVLALVGAGVGATSTVVYADVIRSQGDNLGDVAPWLVVMGLPCVLAAAAAISPRRAGIWLLSTATVILGGVGLLGILTIGLLFLFAGMFTGIAALTFATATPHSATG